MLFGSLSYIDVVWLLFIALKLLDANFGVFSLGMKESVKIVAAYQLLASWLTLQCNYRDAKAVCLHETVYTDKISAVSICYCYK